MCSVFSNSGSVPPNLGLVFRSFSESYENKIQQDVPAKDESREWWHRLLRHLAFTMMQGKERTELQVAIPKEEAETTLIEFLQKYHQPHNAFSWLNDLVKYHLIEIANDQIEFRHQLIQEYYAAEQLLKLLPELSDESLKRDYLNYLKWTEPLALMLTLLEDEAQALRVVKLALEVDWQLGARLAGAARPEFQEKTVNLVAEVNISPLLKIELLSATLSDNSITTLCQYLNAQDSDVRRSAVYALEKISSLAAVDGLLSVLNDQDSDVRCYAVGALGKIASLAAVDGLLSALNDQDVSVRRSVVYALSNIKSPAVKKALLSALKDQDTSVRKYANRALGKAVGPLLPIEPATSIGENTSKILRNIDSQAISETLLFGFQDDTFIPNFDALKNLTFQIVLELLLPDVAHQDAEIRKNAAKVLERIGFKTVDSVLLYALSHSNTEIRKNAAKALGYINSPASIQLLLSTLLNDKHSSVRWYAAEALGQVATPELLSELYRLLNTNQELTVLINAISKIQERCKFYNHTLTKADVLLAQPISIPIMHILHLSDLHFGTPDQANLWSGQLAEDLRQELGISRLDALILSGDIANKSTPEEYAAAKQFLDKFCKRFPLEPSQIIIVPGNHDLNWTISEEEGYQIFRRKSYNGIDDEDNVIKRKGEESSIEVLVPEQYKRRFEHFSNFYEAIKGKPYPLEYDQQYTIEVIGNLLIIGLNSAWQLDHFYTKRASINNNALSNALEEIDTNEAYRNFPLKIAVWHHPLNSAYEDRIKDSSFLERLAVNEFQLFLHGHVHKADNNCFYYDSVEDGRKLHRICAGTFGAPTKELVTATPWQYNLLILEGDKITVKTRKRESENGAWESDARWRQGAGKSSLDYYTINLPPKSEALVTGQQEVSSRELSPGNPTKLIPTDSHTQTKEQTFVVDQKFLRLKDLLEMQNWQEADRETANLIGENISPKIKDFPVATLKEIDKLWKDFSNDRFGFSAQRRALDHAFIGSKVTPETCLNEYQMARDMEEYRDRTSERKRLFAEGIGWYVQDRWVTNIDYSSNIIRTKPEGYLPVLGTYPEKLLQIYLEGNKMVPSLWILLLHLKKW